MRIHQTYERLTFARVRMISPLAEGKTIREAASALPCSIDGARSQVREIEAILDVHSVGEVREWWVAHGTHWLAYAARCGGLLPFIGV